MALFLAAMGSCTDCSEVQPDFPTPTTGLNKAQAFVQGGITGFAFMKCDKSFTDIAAFTEWQTKITAGDVTLRVNCGVQADLVGEAQTTTVGACETEIVTDRDHTINFTDAFDNSDYDVANFYRHLQANPNSYKVAGITCDGLIYPFQLASVNVNENRQNTKSAGTLWQGTFTWSGLISDVPFNPQTATPAFTVEDLLAEL